MNNKNNDAAMVDNFLQSCELEWLVTDALREYHMKTSLIAVLMARQFGGSA